MPTSEIVHRTFEGIKFIADIVKAGRKGFAILSLKILIIIIFYSPKIAGNSI